MPVRRKSERQKCIVAARAYFDGHPALHCSITDVTPEGAKLLAETPIPARGTNILVFIPALGEVWAARIRWRRAQSLGVEFISGEADLTGTEPTLNPDVFALRVQLAQVTDTAKRMAAA